MQPMSLEVGDVVQISPETSSAFAGCFMLVTEPKSFGAQGFISMPQARGQMPGQAYYRARFEEMELIGKAAWMAAR